MGKAEAGDEPRYRLLGPVVAVDADGRSLALGGAQRRGLLAQLLLAPGRVVSVDALTDGLWSDHPPATAVEAIHVHVSHLRAALGADAVHTRPPGYLVTDAGGARDVDRFERALDAAAEARAGGRLEHALDHLRAADGWWRGPALADVADLPFAAAAVARLASLRDQAVDDRMAVELDLGRHERVVADLEALVQHDPLRERRWELLMTALYRCGRQAEALDAYARARAHLVGGLGLEPGPALQRVERHVLHQDLPGPSRATGVAAVAPPIVAPATPPPASPAGPAAAAAPTGSVPGAVVGRERELAGLETGFDRVVEAGAGAGVAVVGEEGVGKTALLGALSSRLSARARVVGGRCREHVLEPFGPWVSILEQVDARAELAILAGKDDEAGEAPEGRVLRLFQGVASRLADAAGHRPLVVVIDDLHWSDDATVRLLQHALDETVAAPVYFVLAWRDREVIAAHPVSRLVHQLRKAGTAVVDLEPLRPADVEELLAAAEPTAAPDDLDRRRRVAAVIHEVTGGVPLFVVEAVAAARAPDGTLRPAGEVGEDLPETARTLVARRLSSGRPEMADVAAAAAVLAEPVEAAVVERLVPSLGADEVLVALDELVEAGLLTEVEGGHTFVHAAYRRAVLGAQRAGRRRLLHDAAFRALEARGAPPAVLAHHALGAGPLVPAEEAVAQLRRAGEEAVARGAFVDAAAFLDRALERGAAAERPALRVALADARWRGGDIAAAKALAAEVVAEALAGSVPETVLVDAVVLHGTFGTAYSIDPASLAFADQALDLVGDPGLRARVLASSAYHHAMWGSTVPTATAALGAAEAALVPSGSPAVEAEVLFARSIALTASPDLDARRALSDRHLVIADELGSVRDRGRAVRGRVMIAMSGGDLAGAQGEIDRLIPIAERLGSWLYLSDAWRWRTAIALAADDGAATEAGLAELERIGASRFAGRVPIGNQRLLLHWASGRFDRSLAYVDAIRAALPATPPSGSDRRLADLVRLELLAELGRGQEVADEFDEIAPHLDLDASSCIRATGELYLTADLVGRLGRADLAPPLIARLEPFGGQLMVLGWGEAVFGAADRVLAHLRSLVAGVVDEAGFDAALRVERAAGATLEVARTDAARARARAQLGAAR